MGSISIRRYECDHGEGCEAAELVEGYGLPDNWKECNRYFCHNIFCPEHTRDFCPEDDVDATDHCGRCGIRLHEEDHAMCRQECEDILCSDCFGDGLPEEEYCTECNVAVFGLKAVEEGL